VEERSVRDAAAADGDQVLVEVAADRLKDGRVVKEILWAEPVQSGGYRLAKSPLVAQGLAVGDEFEVAASDKSFRVLRRGGSLCVQLFMKPDLTRDVFDELAGRVHRELGGDLDAHAASIAGFWVPVSVGFPAVEQVFGDFVAAHAGSEWVYANVYGDDGQPLNWW
jgi:hypothetical protein